MKEELIVIIVQYRLGIMGFFNSYHKHRTRGGNYGLIDQQNALKFIAENAERLGGDENKIMIMGEKSGAASVAYHLLNKESSELVNSGNY
jgi:carboxylesterase type B